MGNDWFHEYFINELKAIGRKPTSNMQHEVVDSLPSSGNEQTIYFVKNDSGSSNNHYDEYVWISSSSTFEKIGSTQIDGSATQPDWNQNDATQPDYVKNRTHYYMLNEIAKFTSIEASQDVVLDIPYSNIPDIVFVEINGRKFEFLHKDRLVIGDKSTSSWSSGEGYGFQFSQTSSGTKFMYDKNRFGKTANVVLYEMTFEKLPHYYIPLPTNNTIGGVKANVLNDLSGYVKCVLDESGMIYSKHQAVKKFSILSSDNIRGGTVIGDFILFTDSIAEEISSVSELVLPVHAWVIPNEGKYACYLLEDADHQVVKFKYYLGGTSNTPTVEVLRGPHSGGSSHMYVKVSKNEDGAYAADHTFAEISEHVNNGGTASVVFININLPIIVAEENALVFSSVIASDQPGSFTVVIRSDNTIFLDNFVFDEHFVPVDVGPAFAGKFLIVGEDGIVGFRDLILPSSTEGSTKKFKITVDDTGTISATEVT